MSPESGFKPINFMPVKKHLYNVQFTIMPSVVLVDFSGGDSVTHRWPLLNMQSLLLTQSVIRFCIVICYIRSYKYWDRKKISTETNLWIRQSVYLYSAGETKHSVQVVFGCFHFH